MAFFSVPGRLRLTQQPAPNLTPAERDILRLLAADLHDDDIAASRGVRVDTMRSQIHRIEAKLGVHQRAALGIMAERMGLVEPDQP